MAAYRHIPFADATGGSTGHHYVSNDNPTDQWDVTFYPHGDDMRLGGDPLRTLPHVRVRVFVRPGEWETRAIVPTGANGAL
jgi:hypothetical protein